MKHVGKSLGLSRIVFTLCAMTLVQACSHGGLNQANTRVFLDSSDQSETSPDWVRDSRVSWEEQGLIRIKSSHTVRGDERVGGCFDLAKLGASEVLLSELANEVRGRIDAAQQTLSEDAETVLGKSLSSDFSGRVTGLRLSERYYVRYLINGQERLDCHVLTSMKKTDYDQLKRAVVQRVVAADPRIKEAIVARQVDLFQ